MGRISREKPNQLSKKLRQIRDGLDFSQDEMLIALGLSEKLFRSAISGYELGTREPSLITLLKYARLAGVSTDLLIDDKLKLPQSLPTRKPKSK
jgi:transcriptional regulator with XRE-family HTH domain